LLQRPRASWCSWESFCRTCADHHDLPGIEPRRSKKKRFRSACSRANRSPSPAEPVQADGRSPASSRCFDAVLIRFLTFRETAGHHPGQRHVCNAAQRRPAACLAPESDPRCRRHRECRIRSERLNPALDRRLCRQPGSQGDRCQPGRAGSSPRPVPGRGGLSQPPARPLSPIPPLPSTSPRRDLNPWFFSHPS